MAASTVARAKFARAQYVAIADAIDGVRAGFDDDGACMFGVEVAAEALSALFSEDNERFDRARFLTACGIVAS
jgi:hypothetical protein